MINAKKVNLKLYHDTIKHLAQMKNPQEEDLRNERRAWDKLIEAGEKSLQDMPERVRADNLGLVPQYEEPEPQGGQSDEFIRLDEPISPKAEAPEEATEAERLATEEADAKALEAAKRSEAARKAAATRAAKKKTVKSE